VVVRCKQRDPIPTFLARVRDAGVRGAGDLAAAVGEAAATVADACAFAEAAPLEPVEDLARDLRGAP
jgi:TPP-dependent pyruvate/acetoin dehydrogenase alpha subunit